VDIQFEDSQVETRKLVRQTAEVTDWLAALYQLERLAIEVLTPLAQIPSAQYPLVWFQVAASRQSLEEQSLQYILVASQPN
jgi:hypothetical protein